MLILLKAIDLNVFRIFIRISGLMLGLTGMMINPSRAQKPDVCQEALKEMEQGNFLNATSLLDYQTIRNPNDANAYYCRGLITFMHYYVLAEQINQLTTTQDPVLPDHDDDTPLQNRIISESPLDRTSAAEQKLPVLLDDDHLAEIELYLKKALWLDPQNFEYHAFLCEVFAENLKLKPLLEQMDALFKQLPTQDSLMYTMAGFAVPFDTYNRTADAIAVLNKLTVYFPNEAYPFTHLGALYFEDGQLDKARHQLAIAMQKLNPDESTYYYSFLVNVIAGDYSSAMDAIKGYALVKKDNVTLLFEGLLAYSQNQAGYADKIKAFFAQEPEADYFQLHALANFLISNDNNHDFESYQKSLKTIAPGHYIALLLHQRATSKFPERIEPWLNYAEDLTTLGSYNRAIEVFNQVLTRFQQIPADKLESLQIALAWAQQALGQLDEANRAWQPLLNSKDAYKRSASAYFYGKNLISRNSTAEARKILDSELDRNPNNKYGYLIRQLRTTLKD